MNQVFKNVTKKFDLPTVACYIMGFILGKVMIHVVNTQKHIHNGFGRFVVEVLIIACSILLIETARVGINKFVRRS